MKKIFSFLMVMLAGISVYACPACEKAQPRLLQGISHGAGPEGKWDLFIVSFFAVIVVFTLYFSIKWLIRPGEKNNNHIKYFILNQQ